MGDISKNLSRHEMACRCGCGFDTIDIELVEVMQEMCDYYAADVRRIVELLVTGPNRCREHNAQTPGAKPNSQHLYGRAMDFKLKIMGEQIPPRDIHKYLCEKYPGKHGFGLYRNRNHVDTRTRGGADARRDDTKEVKQ